MSYSEWIRDKSHDHSESEGSWFQIRGDDQDFWAVICCAVRYSLGRRTYMPELVTTWIRTHCNGIIPVNALNIMLDDISGQRRMGIRAMGDECDLKTWNSFEAWLEEQKGKG